MPEILEGGLDDVVDEGVDGRPVDFEAASGSGWAGDLRERNGEMTEDRWVLLEVENMKERRGEGRREIETRKGLALLRERNGVRR